MKSIIGHLKKFFLLIVTIVSVCITFAIVLYIKSHRTLAEALGYSKNDILVIVNMDDIGVHADVTDASLNAINFGMALSGSVMVPCPDFKRTIEIWKKNPSLDLGIHLTLTCEWGKKYPWTPILSPKDVPNLYNPDGIMWPNVKELIRHINYDEAFLELEAQINSVLNEGLHPTHIDGHMGFYYANNTIFESVMRLSKKYHIPMRVWKNKRYKMPFYANNISQLRNKGYIFPDFYHQFYTIEGEDNDSTIRKKTYSAFLKGLKPGVHEIITHFSLNSNNLINCIGKKDVMMRYYDYQVWTDENTKNICDSLGVTFIAFKQLQQLDK